MLQSRRTSRSHILPGSFVSIYKFLLNALPILFPTTKSRQSIFSLPPSNGPSTPLDESTSSALGMEPSASPGAEEIPLAQRTGRLSLAAQAHQEWVRKKTGRWQSILSGSVAGATAIMFEKKANRMSIAQQLFVRCDAAGCSHLTTTNICNSGLQGSYNALSSKHGIQLPQGAVVVFSLWYVHCIASQA